MKTSYPFKITLLALIGYFSLLRVLLIPNSIYNALIVTISFSVIGILSIEISKIELNIIEKIVTGFTIGLAVITIFSSYILKSEILYYTLGLITLLLILSIIINKDKKYLWGPLDWNHIILGSILIIIPFLVLDETIRYAYPMGWDPWVIKPIVKYYFGEAPVRDYFTQSFVGFFKCVGFFYMVAGNEIFSYLKFFGPLCLAISTLFIYFTSKRIFGKYGVMSPIIFISGVFLIHRFFMPLRENFSFIFLSCSLFLLITFLDQKSKPKVKNGVLIALISSAIILTHPLTTVIYFLTIIIFIFLSLIYSYSEKGVILNYMVPQFILVPLLGFTGAKSFIGIISWAYKTFGVSFIYSLVFLSFILIVLIYFLFSKSGYTHRYNGDLNKIISLLIIFITIGAICSLINPLGTGGNLGAYNPPIKLSDFSPLLILFGFMGTLLIISRKMRLSDSIRVLYGSIIIVILILLNITNFGVEFADFRLIIYITYLLAILSPPMFFLINKKGKLKILIIISLIVLVSITHASQEGVWIAFDQTHFDAVEHVEKIKKENGGLVLPQPRAHFAFDYLGFYHDYTLAGELLKSTSENELIKKVEEKYPYNDTAYLVVLKPKLVNAETKNLLNKNFAKLDYYSEDIEIYIIKY